MCFNESKKQYLEYNLCVFGINTTKLFINFIYLKASLSISFRSFKSIVLDIYILFFLV